MLIKVSDNPTGIIIQEVLSSLKTIPTTPTENAAVITGTNGSGKTALINSLAHSAGLGIRYSSSHSTYRYSHMDIKEANEKYGGASLCHDDDSGPIIFDSVFRYRGDETRMMPLAMDTREDIEAIFSMRGSHGQVNLSKIGSIIRESKKDLEIGSTVLMLFDEPETGLSLDVVSLLSKRFREMCELVTDRNDSWYKKIIVVIATQSPFILKSCQLGGATRIDLGGWVTPDNKDPFQELEDAMLEFLKKPLPTIPPKKGKP